MNTFLGLTYRYYKDVLTVENEFFYHEIFDDLIFEIGKFYKNEIEGKNGNRHKGIKKIARVALENFNIRITNREIKSLRMAKGRNKGWCARVPYSMHVIIKSILIIVNNNSDLLDFIKSKNRNTTNYWSEFLVPQHDFAVQNGKKLLNKRIDLGLSYPKKEYEKFSALDLGLKELEIKTL